MKLPLVFSFVVVAVWAANFTHVAADPVANQHALPPETFQFSSQGHFVGHQDQRDLLVIEHPLKPSQSGDFGFFQTKVELPSDAQPPYRLNFYVTDNNVPAKDPKNYMMIDQRVGHRFREIRINGKTVWSQDTYDAESPRWQEVDITQWVPETKTFVLEAGLFEKEASATVLPGDLVQSPPRKAFRPRQELSQIQSYWGDFVIGYGADQTKLAQPRWLPTLELKKKSEKEFEPWEATNLPVENGNLLETPWSWPAVSGIPFPQSKFSAQDHLAVVSKAGSFPIRVQSRWPDGSIKWGLVQLDLKPEETDTFRIEQVPQEPSVHQPVEINKDAGSLTNGLLELRYQPKANLLGLTLASSLGPVLEAMEFYFTSATESFSTTWHAATLEEQLPERTTVAVEGQLTDATGFSYGRCLVRFTIFAGQPYVRILSTIINENTTDPFQATAYGWKLRVAGAGDASTSEESFTIGSQGGSLTGAVRYFRQLSPNGIQALDDGIDLQLFRAGDKTTPTYQTHPGEAKTHEIWLAVTEEKISPQQASRLSMIVDRPPRLGIAPLIRSSKVWGNLPRIDPVEDQALYDLIQTTVETYYANVRTGIRAFGNYPGFSSSFYWNSLHTLYTLYAMTGERKWLDRAERSVRHLMDLLICHWSPNPKNVGGMYAYFSTKTPDGERAFEPDFSNADFSVRSQNPHAAFNHWQLTGDPEGRRIAIGIADFLINNPEMRDLALSASSRHQGWCLIAVSRAYSETGDVRYKKFGELMVKAAESYIDPRRGAYIQTHSSVTHPGIVPFMSGILATGLRDFHEATGNPDALRLLATITVATKEEMEDKEWREKHPGLSYYYSPNPHHRYEPSPTLSMGLIGANAYLGALTEDPEFIQTAQEGWKGYMVGPHKTPHMTMYDLPETLYWLKSLSPQNQ